MRREIARASEGEGERGRVKEMKSWNTHLQEINIVDNIELPQFPPTQFHRMHFRFFLIPIDEDIEFIPEEFLRTNKKKYSTFSI